MSVLLLGIVFCLGLLQTETSVASETDEKPETTSNIPAPTETPTAAKTDEESETTSNIPVPKDGGFTIVLRDPIKKPEVMKISKDRQGDIKQEPQSDFAVTLPKNALVFFIIEDVDTRRYTVKITVEEGSSQTVVTSKAIEAVKGSVKDTQERSLRNPIKYICVFLPKKGNVEKDFPPPRVVTVTPTTELRGIKATVGPFITPLRDDNYTKIDGRVALGSRDQWSRSPGFLAHIPFFSHNFSRFRCALALSGGLAIGKISTVDDALTIGASPVTVGGSILLAGPATDSLFAITGGGILKPVERLSGYSIGRAYSGDLKDLTKSVNRWHFFLAVTFSYDIFKDLGLQSTNK